MRSQRVRNNWATNTHTCTHTHTHTHTSWRILQPLCCPRSETAQSQPWLSSNDLASIWKLQIAQIRAALVSSWHGSWPLLNESSRRESKENLPYPLWPSHTPLLPPYSIFKRESLKYSSHLKGGVANSTTWRMEYQRICGYNHSIQLSWMKSMA